MLKEIAKFIECRTGCDFTIGRDLFVGYLPQKISPRGPNLILNGDFEIDGAGGADLFQNWTELGTVIKNETTQYSGNSCCELVVPAVPGSIFVYSDTFTLLGGVQYELSYFYRMSTINKLGHHRLYDTGNNIYLDAAGNWQPGSTNINILNETNWTKRSIQFVGHPAYTIFQFYLARFTPSVSLYFDNIRLQELSQAEQDVPIRCVVVLENAGGVPVGDLPDWIDPTVVQIWNRAEDYWDARDDAWCIYDMIHGTSGWKLPIVDGGPEYDALVIDAVAPPAPIENPNDRNHFVFSTNYSFSVSNAP